MTTNTILDKVAARATFTITLDSLAASATAGRQSTMIANASPSHKRAKITGILQSNASAPTVGTVYEIGLIRSDGTNADDGAGASDAALTGENVPIIGTVVVTATANKSFPFTCDTPLGMSLGISWGIFVRNNTGQALHAASGSTNAIAYEYIDDDIQAAA
mgnify:CR=1 FL=1